MAKYVGMNKHQKAAHRRGEMRVGRDEIEELLEMSQSEDPEDRMVAAELLCPCHVRKRIDAVWEALYRMLEDPDVRVRRRAWHTLEDGGRPTDDALNPILERAWREETDKTVRSLMAQVAGTREKVAQAPPTGWRATLKGQCDFCGQPNRPVDRDFSTTIPSTSGPRAALICQSCAR